MTLISKQPAVSKTHTLYLYRLSAVIGLQTKPDFQRVEIKEEDLTIERFNLLEREVIYLPRFQREALPKRLLEVPGFENFLKACSFMVIPQHLPNDIDKGARKAHKFSEKDALSTLNLAANAGFAYAHHVLGAYYNPVLGGKHQDRRLCESHSQFAATHGLITAYLVISSLYKFENKKIEAFDWLLKGANAGDTRAMANLAHSYLLGEGVPTNIDDAMFWFKKAADAGHVNAQFQVALLYSEGGGLQKDLGLAIKYFEMAKENGHLGVGPLLQKVQAELRALQASQKKEAERKAALAELEADYQAKFDVLIQVVNDRLGQYEALKAEWFAVKNKELVIKYFSRFQELQDPAHKVKEVTIELVNEVDELITFLPKALESAIASLEKAKKKAERALMPLDPAPVFVDIPLVLVEETVSETRLIKEKLARDLKEAEEKERIAEAKRSERASERASLAEEYQQKQEALAKEAEQNELLKIQKKAAEGVLAAETEAEPAGPPSLIASFAKSLGKIYNGQRQIGPYNDLLIDYIEKLSHSETLEAFINAHMSPNNKFKMLKNGLGGLVGLGHLEPLQSPECPIYSFKISPSIGERVVFAWKKSEKKAYLVSWVDYHAGKS